MMPADTRNDIDSITPDGLTGAIAAVEGIYDAAVLLNGPTGCKFYHGALCENQMPRADFIDPIYYSEEFYFGQPRVPATYLDDYDYVFGATAKLEKILPAVAAKGHSLIAVINTPGAALIGDDLLRFIEKADLPVPCMAMENTGFSRPPSWGFQRAVTDILTTLSPGRTPKKEKCVNLIGISILHHHWEGNIAELTGLLNACGITVNTVLCAGCTVSGLGNLAAAGVNVVVYEEYARELIPFMAEQFGLDPLVPPAGAPIGFSATESWIESVCGQCDISPQPALALIKEGRKRSHEALNRFNALTGLPKGATFAVEADASIALPLVTWLHEYLGMVPVCVRVPRKSGASEFAEKVKDFLEGIHCEAAWRAEPDHGPPDVVFGSGALITRLRLSGQPFTGIEISLPKSIYQHVIPKAYMGPQGALYLIEQMINGLVKV